MCYVLLVIQLLRMNEFFPLCYGFFHVCHGLHRAVRNGGWIMLRMICTEQGSQDHNWQTTSFIAEDCTRQKSVEGLGDGISS